MGVFVSDFVSARSSPYRPEPLGEARYGLRGHKIQPQNILNKVNMFIKYHIQGIVRVYQWVRNAILL